MPRRTATLLAATLTLMTLVFVMALTPSPYAEMSPGPTVNTLGEHGGEPVLQIEGRKTYPTTGNLNMTTVRVTGSDYRMSFLEAFTGWVSGNDAVVPHDTLYPDDRSAEEVDQENAEEFTASQESAKVAALKELDIPVQSWVNVATVVGDSPAEGRLHAGDEIVAVDGQKVNAPADVAGLVTKHEPGEDTTFTVIPAKRVEAAKKAGRRPSGGEQDVTITTMKAPDDPKRAMVGIQAGSDHAFPFEIDIKLADVGGPSAGLMFSLGIVDKLTEEDLTGGKFIAGTGTIDDDGNVGPIGGVELKTIGAREQGAEYFLTPKANCKSAARDTPDGLTLVEVSTIDDALGALEDIRSGDTDALKTCAKS
ncbi:PDZ domain-containing protein [Streptomyces sp. NPDC051940]|uniref:YlbL family protein n=1 Tax=Streptomyces sp. NPDC051940 TaxID=3155675 RepID=UPI0034155EEB